MKRPIYDSIIQYSRDAGYPWHMPGHKRGKGLPVDTAWQDVYSMDFTEIPGLDEYHSPEGIIRDAQLQAAQLYGVKNSYFLVNGSTVGILAAMSAVLNFGDDVLIARNCHQAVYRGVEILNLNPYYIYPEWMGEWDMYGGMSVEEVERGLKAHPGIRAVILTSPTYEGIVSDIENISEVVHAYGGILIVDEAHGAHLPFFNVPARQPAQPQSGVIGQENEVVQPESRAVQQEGKVIWPKSAIACGADLVIQSLHKTLPALTQTAILHRCTERVLEDRLFHFVSLYQTTSPSYVLMASMDYAVHFMATEKAQLTYYDQRLQACRTCLGQLKHIRLLERKDLAGACAKGYDDAKLVLSVRDAGRNGIWLAEELAKRGQVVEMYGANYVLCMSSVMDSAETFAALAAVMEELDGRLESGNANNVSIFKELDDNIIRESVCSGRHICMPGDIEAAETKTVMHIGKALAAPRAWMAFAQCPGRIAAGYVYAYPPGSPLIVPGEKISGEAVRWIEQGMSAGLNIKGVKNGALPVVDTRI